MQTYHSKEAYLQELRRHLRRLPQDEIDGALAYYEEYIEEAGGDNLAATLQKLGTPREVAAQILRDRAFQELENSPPSAKKGMSAVWMVILGIFAAPIALPLAVLVFLLVMMVTALIIMLLVLLCAVAFMILAALAALTIAGVLGGVAYIVFSVPLMFQHFPSGLFLFGSGLAAAGLGLLSGVGTAYLGRGFWRVVRELFGRRLPHMIAGLVGRRRSAK